MRVFITGGAGFIGCNLAQSRLRRGDSLTIYDNLSRPRTQHNLEWLHEQAGRGQLSFTQGDVRDFDALRDAIAAARPDLIVHLAAQVAVTTSVRHPREDFEINALGTLNVLEAARAQDVPPAVFYSSTNKVYGGMEDVAVVEGERRYAYRDFPNGIDETRSLDFHSPYGCSKGAGDQYVRDYARIYGMRTVVFRQSTIYGPRQFGVEDQGWLAHFVLATVTGRPITIYGDGKQVRDMLHVHDLVAAYDAAWTSLDVASGQIFNVGGGAANTISIWTETGPRLEKLAGRAIPVKHAEWRPGDQPVFIADYSKAQRVLGWTPRISLDEGVPEMWNWVVQNRTFFE